MVEEVLLCKPIELGCRGIDLFNINDNSISTNNLVGETALAYGQMAPKLCLAVALTAKSNSRTCSNGHVDALHDSPKGIGGS